MTSELGKVAPHATVDLTNCDREPIHQLGQVQSYGALLALSSDWIVQHASANLGAILGIEAEAALGRQVTDLIVPGAFDRIRRNLSGVEGRDGVIRLFNVALRESGRAFDLSLHQSGRHLILEFEPKSTSRGADVMSEVYPYIERLRGKATLRELARTAARGMRALSGFDSVMVYQFQPDHSGRVIAEDRRDGTRAYHGLNFPASDIPVQARALYKRSLLRLIHDVRDPGAPILPPPGPGEAPLDLSLAVTRSVSPIHIEYLTNMGVAASMSVSIMKDGALWGLFACHHDTPRYIDYESRTAIEMYGHLFSYELSRFEEGERHRAAEDAARLQTLLMAKMAHGDALADSLLDVSEDIERVIPHDGVVLFVDGEFQTQGAAPTRDEFRFLARMLDTRAGTGVFLTDRLAEIHPPAQDYVTRCAGIMAIPISKRPRDYLVLCRRPVTETVQWAGNPEKPVSVGPSGARLTPRKSFEIWRETVDSRTAPWASREIHAAELLRVVLLEIFLKITDSTAEERRRAQEQQQLLIAELNHRVRNILNLMRGLISQSKSGVVTLAEFTDSLDGRIRSIARAHDQLSDDRWEPSALKALIRGEVEAHLPQAETRVSIEGPDAMLSPPAYTALALVMHELVTNAQRHGALGAGQGTVEITTSFDPSGTLEIHWAERGGPPVTAPRRRGFGMTIIEQSVPHELGGEARLDLRLTGAEAWLRIPGLHAKIGAPGLEGAVPMGALSGNREFQFTGKALVLEDALIIAMDAAGMLEDFGASEVKICATVADAMRQIEEHRFDLALLDVNLGEELSAPVAHRLAAQGVPFLLTTGYGRSDDIRNSYPPCEIVQKPFTSDALRAAIAQVLAGA